MQTEEVLVTQEKGTGKGLSREQKTSLNMVKHIMLSLDEEDGLDQIYTFSLACFCQTLDVSHFFLSFSFMHIFS